MTPIMDRHLAAYTASDVTVIIAGSLWMMDHLNHNMLPMHK